MLYDKNGVYDGSGEFDGLDVIMHYGTPHVGMERHSGRYPWGSGDHAYQRNYTFLAQVEKMRRATDAEGKKIFRNDTEIARSMNMNSSDLRKRISLARAENRQILRAKALELKEKYPDENRSAIARRMGMGESSLRSLLDEDVAGRMGKISQNAKQLKDKLNEEPGTYLQVGRGAEYYLDNATSHSLNTALKKLEDEGYTIHSIPIKQLGTGKTTTMKVLAAPGVTWAEIINNKDKIRVPTDLYFEDNGDTIRKVEPYQSIDSSRVMVNYSDTGDGASKDGVIELRRGVKDLDLGYNHYAQVRILVDGTHYLKGMAMYADDLPDGVDIRFNTNKKSSTPMINPDDPDHSVLKPIKKDLENPFGANIKDEEKLTRAQRHYIGDDGKEHLSAINIVKEEGDVESWSKNLAAQFLSKQPPTLAKHQLQMSYDIAKAEFDEIAAYDNPVVKAKMLEDFAGRCETDAVHLQAAKLPRQANKFILPLTNISDTECYAPGYKDGEQLALVRYPHGGPFEIPIVTVNNQNKHAKSVIGDAIDAVGIHPRTAERLSGADFDGDTVLAIPVDNLRLRATANNRPAAFKDLEGFDPKTEYAKYPGMHVMTEHQKGVEMGKVTNLITDMYAQRAPDEEICRAVKHSMVVIDAYKHELDFRRSEKDNRIAELKAKYQSGGASTLLSASTSDVRVADRKEKAPSKMTPEEKERWKNGEIIYEYSGKMTRIMKPPKKTKMTPEEKELYNSGPDGEKEVVRRFIADGRAEYKDVQKLSPDKSTRGAEENTWDLVSTKNRETTSTIERVYGDHAVAMHELAREARKLARAQVAQDRDPEARKEYAREVESIEGKLAIARRNAPLENQAQMKANQAMGAILESNPSLKDDAEHLRRERGRQLEKARKAIGAKKLLIGSKDNPLTEKEWEAIQHNAVSKTTLKAVLQNADMKRVRELAMPKTKVGIPAAKLRRAQDMLERGYSRLDVAEMLDISQGTLLNAIENGDIKVAKP